MIGKTAKAEPGMGGAAIATMTETKTSFASIIVSTDPADIYVRTQTIEPSIIAPQGIYMTMPSGSPDQSHSDGNCGGAEANDDDLGYAAQLRKLSAQKQIRKAEVNEQRKQLADRRHHTVNERSGFVDERA